MQGKTRIAVIGAGLGGLSAGGFLRRAGFNVKIYEEAPTFSRIGAGIVLSANAVKAFRRLDVEDDQRPSHRERSPLTISWLDSKKKRFDFAELCGWRTRRSQRHHRRRRYLLDGS
jgi:2-polyprenyl-6-methoxyphenol hydroxylase-like FAD-dependent oxidoreductase